MMATARRFATPRWLLAHILVWAGVVTMVLLGRWQLDVSNAKHFDLQNFGYSFQWWAFAAFTAFMWARAMRDAIRRHPDAPSTSGELVLRGGANGLATVGPAELSTTGPDGAPVRYRGYVMPQSSQRLARSEGDPLHGAYNDYLWQLALADGQELATAARDSGGSGAADRPASSEADTTMIGNDEVRALDGPLAPSDD